MTTYIVVFDADPQLAPSLAQAWSERRFAVAAPEPGEGAEAALGRLSPDLALVGWHQGGARAGLDLVREFRRSADWARRTLPLIVVAPPCDEWERVAGLEAGADDFVMRPFGLAELEARVGAVLRRRGPAGGAFRDGHLEIVPGEKHILVGGQPRALSLHEWVLLTQLLESREAVSRARLLRGVWGAFPPATPRSIDNLVLRLRKALEPDPLAPRYLVTRRGEGYQFVRRAKKGATVETAPP